jgi:hypothetical protein
LKLRGKGKDRGEKNSLKAQWPLKKKVPKIQIINEFDGIPHSIAVNVSFTVFQNISPPYDQTLNNIVIFPSFYKYLYCH